MTRMELSRRRVLGSLATVGTLGAMSGAGANAILRDSEAADNELVAGALDLEVCVDDGDCDPGPGQMVSLPIDLDAAREGRATIRVEIPDDGRNNPGYVWFRTNCPMGRCGLEQALRMTVREDRNCNGESDFDPVLARGSLCEVMKAFGSGQLLRSDPVQPGERICFELSWLLTGDLCEDDAVTLDFEFFAHQVRHSGGPQRPWSDTCNVVCKTAEECACDEGPGISFVAFCVPDGAVLGPEDVEFTWRTDGEGDPVSVRWDSTVELSTVVLYYGTHSGPVFENFDGGSAGTATVGEGDPGRPGQTPPSPAPEGETGLKYEYDEVNDAFVLEPEAVPLVQADPSTPGADSDSIHSVEISVPDSLDGLPLQEFEIEYAGDFDLGNAVPTLTTAAGETATVSAVTVEETELSLAFEGMTTLVGGTDLRIEYAPVAHPADAGQYSVEATVTAGESTETVAGAVRVG
ncbi:MAG: hypothetical protein ACOCSF_06180 [Halanaeroarchaeum sp.]